MTASLLAHRPSSPLTPARAATTRWGWAALCALGVGLGLRADPVDPLAPLRAEQQESAGDPLATRPGNLERSIEDGLYSQGVRAHEKLADPLHRLNDAGSRIEALGRQQRDSGIRLRDMPGTATNDNVRALLQTLRQTKGLPPLEAAPLAGAESEVWRVRGNVITREDAFLGTRNDQPLVLGARGGAGLRILPTPFAPNLLGGSPSNQVDETTIGAVVAGGGDLFFPNRANSDYGVVGGGLGNLAGASSPGQDQPFATVGGGRNNAADHRHATVSGGLANRAGGVSSTVAGGQFNRALGEFATVAGGFNNSALQRYASVAGGYTNAAVARGSTISGGELNSATGVLSAVGGGLHNLASGERATVPGGSLNLAGGRDSLAAGHAAQALHDGAFVWSDRDPAHIFASTAPNQFLVRAAGNMGVDDNEPLDKLTVRGAVSPSENGTFDLGRPERRWRTLHLEHILDFRDGAEIRSGGKPVLRLAPGGAVDIPGPLAATRIRFPDGSEQSSSATNLLAQVEARWAKSLADLARTPTAPANAPDLLRRLESLEVDLRTRFAAEMHSHAEQFQQLSARVGELARTDGPGLARNQAEQAAALAALRADLERTRAGLGALPSTNTVLLASDLARLRQQVAQVVEAGNRPAPAPTNPPAVTVESVRAAIQEVEARWQNTLSQEAAAALTREERQAVTHTSLVARVTAMEGKVQDLDPKTLADGVAESLRAQVELSTRVHGLEDTVKQLPLASLLKESEASRTGHSNLVARVEGLDQSLNSLPLAKLAADADSLAKSQTALVSRVESLDQSLRALPLAKLSSDTDLLAKSQTALVARVEGLDRSLRALPLHKLTSDADSLAKGQTALVTRVDGLDHSLRALPLNRFATETAALAKAQTALVSRVDGLDQTLRTLPLAKIAADTESLAKAQEGVLARTTALESWRTQWELRAQAWDGLRVGLVELERRMAKGVAATNAAESVSPELARAWESVRQESGRLAGKMERMEAEFTALVNRGQEWSGALQKQEARLGLLEVGLREEKDGTAALGKALRAESAKLAETLAVVREQQRAQSNRVSEAETRLARTAALLAAETADVQGLAEAQQAFSNRLEQVRVALAQPRDNPAALAEATNRMLALEKQLSALALAQVAATNQWSRDLGRARSEAAAERASANQESSEREAKLRAYAESTARAWEKPLATLREEMVNQFKSLPPPTPPVTDVLEPRLRELRAAVDAQTAGIRQTLEARLQRVEAEGQAAREALAELRRLPDLRPALESLGARVEALERAQRALVKPAPAPDFAALDARYLPRGAGAWVTGGNGGVLPGRDFLGTTDEAPLELRVNNTTALRVTAGAETPNWVGGHGVNTAHRRNGATIAGGGAAGQPNTATGNYAFIGGGLANEAGLMSVVGGGAGNLAAAATAVIGGGFSNRTSEAFAVVAGGAQNEAVDRMSSVGGGTLNRAGGSASVIGGGRENQTSAAFATIPGGRDNLVKGAYGFAAGRRAKVLHEGALVWADASDEDAVSERPNQFLARATGGVTLRTAADGQTGVELAPGGNAWSVLSARAAKENFVAVDPEQVLQRVGALPLATWNLRTQDPAVRHLGPVAEDFHAAFGLGESAARIHTGDADGVALAAIQALLRRNERMERELEALRAEVRALRGAAP